MRARHLDNQRIIEILWAISRGKLRETAPRKLAAIPVNRSSALAWLRLARYRTEKSLAMACLPADTPLPAGGRLAPPTPARPEPSGENDSCGDVELQEISLVEEDLVARTSGVHPSDSDTDDVDDDDEEAGLLTRPRGADVEVDSTAADVGLAPRSLASLFDRLPTGEAVMLLGTFVLAFQNIVAKTVERRVPPMQVVFIRSIISGSVTVYTTYQYQRAHNRKVIAKRRARGVGGGEGAATAAGASGSMPADSAASRERPEDDDNVRAFTVETFAGDRSLWHLCAVRGVVGATAFSLAYVSLTYLTVGDSVAIFFLNPIFSSILAWPVLGEAVGAVEAAAILFGLVGTLLIVKPPALFGAIVGRETTPPDTVGVVITVFSALCCSVAMITIRYIGKRVSPLNLATWFHGSSTLIGAMSTLAGWPLAPVMPNRFEWSLLVVISFTSFAGQLSLNYGYSHLPTLTASALYYLLVVWSALLGVAVMGEGMDAFGACGAAVICLGGLLPSVDKARLRRAERRLNGGK